MRIAICDDEEIYRVQLKTILDKLLINVDYDIDTFSDGNILSDAFGKCPYDLVFLDIDLFKEKQGSTRQIIVKEEGEEIVIDVSDVIYMESMNQNVRIVTVKGEHTIRYNMGDFEEELKNDGFFRIHRGYLVSLSKVKKLSKNDAIMEGDVALPVSRSNVKPLKDALYAYVEGSAF